MYKRQIQTRAAALLDQACALLQEIEQIGLEEALERGLFADIKRSREGGKGKDGVVAREEDYYNPFPALFLQGSAKKDDGRGC